jgi:hypothetical protein
MHWLHWHRWTPWRSGYDDVDTEKGGVVAWSRRCKRCGLIEFKRGLS